jgi:hypothetical protein
MIGLMRKETCVIGNNARAPAGTGAGDGAPPGVGAEPGVGAVPGLGAVEGFGVDEEADEALDSETYHAATNP